VRYLSFVLPILLVACASTPRAPTTPDAADFALKMVGKPYRYGGATPAGFDCSGLVLYSYKQAGVSLPRSTDAQREISRSIRRSSLKRGDLVFFDLEGKKNSHVGIYLGDGRFVHAPSSGKHVRTDSLDAPFWRKHFSEARRLG
jgi:cell wall-associated NlpC family hydrolase